MSSPLRDIRINGDPALRHMEYLTGRQPAKDQLEFWLRVNRTVSGLDRDVLLSQPDPLVVSHWRFGC